MHNAQSEQAKVPAPWRPFIKVYRYRVYRRDIERDPVPERRVLVKGCSVCELDETDVDELLQLPERTQSEDVLRRRFRRGDVCLGVRKEHRIIGLIWGSFDLLYFGNYKVPLRDDEVYMLDAYVVPEMRGKGVAHLLHSRSLALLESRGIRWFYSVTIKGEEQAMKFRKRIDSPCVDRGFSIRFFNRWRIGTRGRPEKIRVGGD